MRGERVRDRRRLVATLTVASTAASLALFGAAFGVVKAHGDTNLTGYALFAHAAGFEGSYDSPTAQTHPEGQGVVPDAEVSFNYGPLGYALATVAWPGTLLANAGDTLIIGGGTKVPPALDPTLHQISYPVRAEARNPSGPTDATFTVPGTTMTSHTDDNGAQAVAGIQALDMSGAGSAGTITAQSNASISANQAVSQAVSKVSNINLAGGVVQIASVVSSSTATTDGNKATGVGTTTISGLTIAGQPATIDQTGVHIGQQGAPANDVLNQLAQQAFSKAGISMFLAKPTQLIQGATVTQSAGSLVIDFLQSGNNFLFTFGGATAIANASPSFDFSAGVAPPPAAPAAFSIPPAPLSSPSGGGSTYSVAATPTPLPQVVPAPKRRPATSSSLPATILAAVNFSQPTAAWLVLLGLLLAGAAAAGLRRLGDAALRPSLPACDGEGT